MKRDTNELQLHEGVGSKVDILAISSKCEACDLTARAVQGYGDPISQAGLFRLAERPQRGW